MPSAKIRGRRRRCAGVATALGWEPAVPPTTKSAAANQAKLTRMSLPMRWGVLTVEVVIIESCHRIILSIFGDHVTSPGIGRRHFGWCRCLRSPAFHHSEVPLMGRRMLHAILALNLASATVAAQAQTTGRITGTVTVEGRGLPNANVIVLGTNPVVGAIADANGRYSLGNVPAGAQQVQARLIGYTPITRAVAVTAGESVTLDFALAAQAVQLRGMVTVGYGEQSRREVTGAVSSLMAQDIHQIVAGNPLDAIKGRIPGVDVTASSFEPGAADAVRLRGIRSISASNAPLSVVDGVPITGDLRDIDFNSIENIDVLKDASAAAVYGSRGANGVIMLTTKKGGIGGITEFTLNSTYGLSRIRREVPMMNGLEFANFRRESCRNGGTAAAKAACANYFVDPTACDQFALDPTMRANLAAGVSTDWQHELLRTGALGNTQIGFSGGNAETRFRLGVGALNQTGIATAQAYNDRTLSFNVSHLHNRLSLQLGLQAAKSSRDLGLGAIMWDEALFNPPLGRARDSTG